MTRWRASYLRVAKRRDLNSKFCNRKINAVNVAELICTGNYDEILDKERQMLGRDASGNNDDTTANGILLFASLNGDDNGGKSEKM